MKCKIIFERDPKTLKVTDKIKAVKAPNGNRSILFDDIRTQVVDDKLSLETYYKTYTDEFKDKFGGLSKDKNDEVLFEEVKDIILPSKMLASVEDDVNIDDIFKELEYNTNVLSDIRLMNFKVNSYPELASINTKLDDLIFEGNELHQYIKELESEDAIDTNTLNNYYLELENIHKEYDILADKLEEGVKTIIIPDVKKDIDSDINLLKTELSKYASNDSIDGILQYIIKDNYELQSEDNIELAKQLIKGIIENPGLYSASSGTQSNNIRSKYFADSNTQSHRDILQKIVDSGKGFNPLAKKLLTINSKNIPITLKPVNSLYSFTDDFGNKQSSVGFYSNGKIEMAEFGNYKGGEYGFESNVIHEILHAFTYNELRANTKNAQELKAIYNEALKYKDSFSDQYSISNIDEFLVAIFTNANFIKDIQKIPSIYPEKHQSLWEDVLEFFKKWFKFNDKEATLLDDAFYVANKILIDYSNDPDSNKYKELLNKERQASLEEEYIFTDDEGNPLASISDPSDTQIEDQFKLRNEDGSRKRYTENKALELARKLNKANPNRPFKFTVIKIMGEKGDNRVYHAVKVVERTDNQFSLSGSNTYQGQPETTQQNSIKLNISEFQKQVGTNGYSDKQIEIMTVYNDNTAMLTGVKVPVKVADIPDKRLRESFEKKGFTVVDRYETVDGWITYRVSDKQDLIKTKGQSVEKAKEQENNPKSKLARKRGTEMHDLNQRILESLVKANDPRFNIDVYRDTNFALWFGTEDTPGAFQAFKETDEYKKLLSDGFKIFDNEIITLQNGDTVQNTDATKMVDKLVKSMMQLYHQVYMTQKQININEKTNHRPIFLTETPLLDKEKSEAGTMDIAVIFSDGTASIFDHKFTDLQATVYKYTDKDKAKKEWNEIKRIRKAQGLPVDNTYNQYQDWYYKMPDTIELYKKEDSWNSQIGRYSEMLTKLYGIKSIRQARILPVATTYTKIKNEYDPEKSKVAVILTGDNDSGISQIALEVEKTGDVNLDRFIQMLIDNKHALAKERLEKKAYDDPKYNDRINKLDASIQALLLSRDVTKITDSIQSLADQIKLDLDNVDNPITFTDIINHLKEIEMYESFIRATAGELDKMEEDNKDKIKAKETNPYTTFKERLGGAKVELDRAAEAMHNKMTSMIYEENASGKFMSTALFKSFEKQVDMGEIDKFFTHLREVNHPIVSLFSQLLDKVNTNRLMERRELETKINKINKELTAWGDRNGLSGPNIYKPLLDDKLNLVHKFRHYVKEDFKDHLDIKNHAANVKWFKENFERVGIKEEQFQNKLKAYKEYINKTYKTEKERYEALENWLDKNDINHKDGNNNAWYNQYVQYWLTPKNPDEYYTDEYRNLLKPGNEALLNFYNFYTEQMNKLGSKVDFHVSDTMVAEIRKDTIDTMVQDGIFAGWKQQGVNLYNYFSKHDKDDGFQTIDNGTKNGRKVPIFFTDSVGVENKSFDLAKSLMIFSDFVNNYSGVKDMEHAVLAMRELVSKTSGVRTNWKGKVLRTAEGEIELKDGPNEKLLNAFDKWINYYIYGETKEGDPFQNKVVDAMTAVSSRKSVALNFLSAVGGHISGAAQLDMIATKAFQFDDKLLKQGRKEAERKTAFWDTMGRAKDETESLSSKSVFADFFFEPSQSDLSYEKANSVSLASMRKAMAKDYAFILQRWSDNVIDSTVLNTMLMSYGIDLNTGKTYPIKRLKEMYPDSKIEWKSLWDSLDMEHVDKNGNKQPVFINQHTGEVMNNATYTDFRRKVKALIAKAKGNMSDDDIAGYKTHMVGRLVMQFRGWIPATVRERVKGEQYSLTMEQFEVGRWIAAYEMVGKNLKRLSGKFIKQMIPFVNADFSEGMNDPMHPMRIKYNQYIADNPHLKPDPANPSAEHITYEQYYNTYVGEVKALAKEVQLYLALAAALGLIMFAAGDDELQENPVLKLATALCQRTMLEIGFYVPVIGAQEQYQLLVRQPVSSLSLLADAAKAVQNTGTEFYDTVMGADWDKTVTPKLGDNSWELDFKSRPDNSPWLYYSHQFIPPVKFMFDIFQPLNTTDRKDTVYDYLLDNSTMVYRY